MKKLFLLLLTLSSLTLGVAQPVPLGATFTYQGRLSDGANPANGSYGMLFYLYDAPTNGTQLGNLGIASVPVSNGLFTAQLDFGATAFDGNARWLEIAVQTNGAVTFTPLTPRQPVTPTPYALFAPTAATANSVATAAVQNAGLAPDAVTGDKVAKGSIQPNNLDTNAFSTTFWQTTGNSGTTAGTHFLGTTDGQPLEFKVGGKRVLRLEQGIFSANFIAGSFQNSVSPGIEGASIVGGGQDFNPNIVSASYATISGGTGNEIRNNATGASVGGGGSNAIYSNAYNSTISGGGFNEIGTNSHSCAIGGGSSNIINGHSANSTIGGGTENRVENDASESTIAGGTANLIQTFSFGTTIGGGYLNTVQAQTASATIGGGNRNTIQSNTSFATIGGGFTNWVGPNAWAATVSGGESNTAKGTNSTVPGGLLNVAAGNFSLAAGHRAKANHDGAFVWSDSGAADFSSTATNEFAVRATGGVRFVSAVDSGGATLAGVSLPAGSGSWSTLSDHNAKENFSSADTREILERVAALPIQTWNYKTQDKAIRHLGPMAQDFHAAFGVGEDDRHITTVDESGVALAAIQGLNQKVESQQAALRAKDARLAALERQNQILERRLNDLEQTLSARFPNQLQTQPTP